MPSGSHPTSGQRVTRTVYADDAAAAEEVGRTFAEVVQSSGDGSPESAAARERMMTVVARHPGSGLCKVPILEEMVESVAEGVFGDGSPLVSRFRDVVVDALWSDAQNRRRIGRVWQQLQERAGNA